MYSCGETGIMIEKLVELVNADEALVHRARWMNADMLLVIGDAAYLLEIRDGRIVAWGLADRYLSAFDFAIHGTAEAWTEFWQPVPKPRHHDIIALMREGKMRIDGNVAMAMANLLTIKLMLEKPRQLGAAT